VISTLTGSSSSPPACWKYVNWVISSPLSQTSQPSPQAPSAGDSQLSSTKRMSFACVSIPIASRLRTYSSWGSPGSGLRITWNCRCVWIRFGFSP
jgi:hypothetical protein